MGRGGAFRVRRKAPARLVLHVLSVLQLLISIFSITALTRQRALAAPRLTEHASRAAKSGGDMENLREVMR